MLQSMGFAGFRSYTNNRLEVVEFETPLTLILGKNGSGKTTILEVLKFLCTGAYPLSSDRGRKFIIEPRLVNLSTVNVDARIKFLTFNNRQIIAKRRLSLTMLAKTMRLSSLEQSIKTTIGGQTMSVSNQCAEIEKQIPGFLDISAALLQKVMICTHDESFWMFEDSSVLKNVFDELLQTKNYAKLMDNFWDRQRMVKQDIKARQGKRQLLEKMFEADKNRRQEDYKEKAAIQTELDKLDELKVDIKRFEQEIKRQFGDDIGKIRESINTKNVDKGIKVNQIEINDKQVKSLESQIESIKNQYMKITGNELACSEDQISSHNLRVLQENLKVLLSNRQQYQAMYEAQKNSRELTEVEAELKAEIKQAKQLMPGLKGQNNSDLILQKLREKKSSLEQQKKELMRLRQDYERIQIPPLSNVQEEKRILSQDKERLQKLQQNLDQIGRQIRSQFAKVYRAVPRRSQYLQVDRDAERKLQNIQMRLEIKREEVRHFSNIPDLSMLRENKFRAHFTSVELWQTFYRYCKEKGKCSFCSKSISKAELSTIKVKIDQRQEKNKKQMEQIEAELEKYSHIVVDPIEAMNSAQQEVDRLQKEEEVYLKKVAMSQEQQRIAEQRKINETLKLQMREIGLSIQEIAISEQRGSIENFHRLVRQYSKIQYEMRPIEQSTKQREGRLRRLQQQMKQQEEKQSIGRQMRQTEPEVSNLPIFDNMCIRLERLVKRSRRKGLQSNTSDENLDEDYQKQITRIDQEIRVKQMMRDFVSLKMKVAETKQETEQHKQVLRSINEELQMLERQYRLYAQKKSRLDSLSSELKHRQEQLQMRITLSMSKMPFEGEAHAKSEQMKINILELELADLEKQSKAVQAATNFHHLEKMKELNHWIEEIWRDVYHGRDIQKLYIECKVDEESKKKKTYNYSLMMIRAGAQEGVEMRGRCSNGQRVLASIVVRLALCKAFTISGNILTLDEPTVNLDSEHRDKLASQLSDIIKTAGSNIQMIVVSHDPEFIKRMQEHTQNYLEVSRDEEGFSRVVKKSIRGLI